MKNWVFTISKKFHSHGIKLWYLRDPIKKSPSVSLSMLFISFHLVVFSLLNKVAGWVDGMDTDATLYFFIINSGLYFSRSVVGSKDSAELQADNSKE